MMAAREKAERDRRRDSSAVETIAALHNLKMRCGLQELSWLSLQRLRWKRRGELTKYTRDSLQVR
jgi:hypothetical protein